MEIAGLPLHPLVVHAGVTLIPLSAAMAIALAVLPRWRWLTRWPTAAVAVGALVVAWVARLSGAALLEARPFLLDADPLAARVERHQQLGETLSLVMIPFVLLVLVAAWALGGTTALASGRGARKSRRPSGDKPLGAVLILAALGVLALVGLVGDSGARAVWG